MNIDLTPLYNRTQKEIEINNTYQIPQSYYQNSTVKKIKDLKVKAKISLLDSDEKEEPKEYIEARIKGILILEDSISLENIEYPFSIDYDDILEENCKKNENTLDIFQFLWENIVLEIPLQFTKVEDLSKFHGDGWKLISEDELETTKN